MDWMNLSIFSLIAIGAIATASAANEIRKLLTTSRPLPWTALVELEKQLSNGRVSRAKVKIHLETMFQESPPVTIGDWAADQACLDILRRLGLVDLVDRQSAGHSYGPGRLGKGHLSLVSPALFPKASINRES